MEMPADVIVKTKVKADGTVERVIGLIGLAVGISVATGSAKQLAEVLPLDNSAQYCALLFSLVGSTAFWLSFFDAVPLRRFVMGVSCLSWVFIMLAYFTDGKTPPTACTAMVLAYFCCDRIWRLK